MAVVRGRVGKRVGVEADAERAAPEQTRLGRQVVVVEDELDVEVAPAVRRAAHSRRRLRVVHVHAHARQVVAVHAQCGARRRLVQRRALVRQLLVLEHGR